MRNQTDNQTGLSEPHPYNLRQAMVRFERGYIANILELTRWDLMKTAQMLGISMDILVTKIRNYQLSKDGISLIKKPMGQESTTKEEK